MTEQQREEQTAGQEKTETGTGQAEERKKRRLSSFTVILIMITLMVVGAATIPLLSVQYSSSRDTRNINISYSWYGASARLIEQELTSKIEGARAPISGIRDISSQSGQGNGHVSLSFKKNVNMDAVRFEISSRLKQIYPSFPSEVRYPYISNVSQGGSKDAVLTYAIKADLPTGQIQAYAEDYIQPELMKVKGVDQVNVSGGTGDEWVITFDPEICSVLGIRAADIGRAVSESDESIPLGLAYRNSPDGNPESILVSMHQSGATIDNWENIQITSSEGRMIRLADIASMRKQPRKPTNYYRINGLNNVNITVYGQPMVNTLNLVKDVDQRVEQLRGMLPQGFSISKEYDASVYINKELTKIYWRTGLSILILLMFVFIMSRSLRYLLLIVITMTANILVAFVFYNLFGIEIHIYSLAGITVSLGLIIDTSIIMIDHYGRFTDRKVFLAIMGALLTTIGALLVVRLIPGFRQIVDFANVIIINLTISMVISVLFIPALLEKIPLRRRSGKRSRRRKGLKRAARFTGFYERFIAWNRRRRWAYIVIAVLAFGLPVDKMPANIGKQIRTADQEQQEKAPAWIKLYNSTIGSPFYQDKMKTYVEYALGGTQRLFSKNFSGANFRSDPVRMAIQISASLPEGCTVHQLNEVMVDMENFLAQFDGIETFTTNIGSYDNGMIKVLFTPEAEKSGLPNQLFNRIQSKASSLGGASWSIMNVGQNQYFNNSLSSGYRNHSIILQGYNYDQLYRIALEVYDTISANPRVQGPEIMGGLDWGSRINKTEFFLDMDFEKFALYNVSPASYYSALNERLYRRSAGRILDDGELTDMVLTSSEAETFDAWHIANDILTINDRSIKLSEFGSFDQRRTGNNINKYNQQYRLHLRFNFIGSEQLARRFVAKQSDRLKDELPVGYSVISDQDSGGWWSGSSRYWMLLLIIVIIYFICAVLFESLRQPLVVITMIPISYIGVFLTFYLFKLNFDDGGFASFVLLSGLVVNAGIYIINEYNIMRRKADLETKAAGFAVYLRAYNRKIIPILLTVISTVLGLIPFVIISREPFWFTFAAGAMGGMMFSLLAIFIFLPIFMPFAYKNKKKQ